MYSVCVFWITELRPLRQAQDRLRQAQGERILPMSSLRSVSYPAQRSTGSAGYLRKRVSTSERSQRTKTDPRALSTRRDHAHDAHSPATLIVIAASVTASRRAAGT